MTDDEMIARARGYTKMVYIEGGAGGFTALILPDTDLDSSFKAFDTDNGEWMTVYGYNCDIRDMDDAEG